MPLRLMQVVIAESATSAIDAIIEERQVVGVWRDARNENHIALQLVVPAEDAEAIMDRVEQTCADQTGFAVQLLPIEAILPRPRAAEEEESGETPKEEPSSAPTRVSREELYAKVLDGLGSSQSFLVMTTLSAVVAAIGLHRDDIAVIIGAMVIAPLLGPNVALALATTLGDKQLALRSLRASGLGVSLALALALGIGLAFPIDPSIPAIDARTQVGLSDLALALASGAAGTYAFTSSAPSSLIGVMVAVALMPPLVVTGLLLGSGHWGLSLSSLLLLAVNLICINLAGVLTFLLQGVRPRSWWEANEAKAFTRRAVAVWVILLLILAALVAAAKRHQMSRRESQPAAMLPALEGNIAYEPVDDLWKPGG